MDRASPPYLTITDTLRQVILRKMSRAAANNPLGSLYGAPLLCSCEVLTRISEKRINSSQKLLIRLESRMTKEPETGTLAVPYWTSPGLNGGKPFTLGHVEI